MNQPQKSRIRIEVFRAMILKHKGEDERSQYKVTPYKVLQYGVVPQVYQSEYDQLTQAIIDSKKVIDDNPLPLQEQFSYSTFFAENPDKICGEAVVTTSGNFAIKVKGNRQTVEDAIKKTLEKTQAKTDRSRTFVYRMKSRPFGIGCQPHNSIKYIDLNKKETGFYGELTYDRELTEKEIYDFELVPVNESGTINNEISTANLKIRGNKKTVLVWFNQNPDGKEEITVLISIEFDGEKLRLGSDGYPQWNDVRYNSEQNLSYKDITDKERIRQYFDNPLIKELLQPYYPKTESEADRARRLRLLKLRTQSFSFSQTI